MADGPLVYHNRTGGCPRSGDGKHSWTPILITIPAKNHFHRPEHKQGAQCVHCGQKRNSKP